MLFSAGMSRPESLVRSARILEGLAATKQDGGAPQDALSIRLLTIQVLQAWQAYCERVPFSTMPNWASLSPYLRC